MNQMNKYRYQKGQQFAHGWLGSFPGTIYLMESGSKKFEFNQSNE